MWSSAARLAMNAPLVPGRGRFQVPRIDEGGMKINQSHLPIANSFASFASFARSFATAAASSASDTVQN